MSVSELLVILIVTMVVFGPKKLPMAAHHLGKLVARFNYYKQQMATFWQQQLNEQQLRDNIKKAQEADDDYNKDIKL